MDSDPNPATNETSNTGPPFQLADATKSSAGLVRERPRYTADKAVYMQSVRRDGNNDPILDFQDPNQPEQVTGYSIYRSSNPSLAPATWPLVAGNVKDRDAAMPDVQWIDQTGGTGTSIYQVTAYSVTCNTEGPR